MLFPKKYVVGSLLLLSTLVFAQGRIDKINVDNIQLDGNTISTTNSNGDLTLDMNGSGRVLFTDLTATTVPYLDSNKKLQSSAVTPTELGYLTGVSSAIQTQLGTKAPSASPTFTGTITTPLTASRACIINGSQQLAVSSVTDTELGYLSGVTSAVQTQINNKLTSPLTTTGDLIYSSSGSTAARLAVGSNSQVLKVVAGVPSWANFSGGINYVTDTDGSAIGSWVTYADAGATSPVDMTGGSPSSTYATSSDSSLRGSTNFLWTHSAANRQGEGFSYNFTIDPSDKGKVLQVTFEYLVASGTYADDDLQCWIYDRTNSALIQPAPYKIKNSSLIEKAFMEFQTASSSTSYRFGCHVATTTATAYTMRFGNWAIGPQGKLYGSPITDLITYTPTLNSNTSVSSNVAYWRRSGDMMQIQGRIVYSGAGNNSVLTVDLPSGYTIDANKFSINTSTTITNLGYGSWWDTGTDENSLAVKYSDSNTVNFFLDQTGGGFNSNLTANGDEISYNILVPIQGWGSTQISSSDSADSRIVSARSYRGTDQTGVNTNNSSVKVTLNTTSYDTHLAFDTSNNRYIVQVPGKYQVTGNVYVAGTNVINNFYASQIYKNGSVVQWGASQWPVASGPFNSSASITLDLVAGDYIELYLYGSGNNSASTLTVASGSALTSLVVTKLQGPAQVMASETVSAKYRSTAANNLVTDTIIDFATKDWDSHGAVTTGASWKFTAPVSGEYMTCTNYFLAGATAAAIGSFVGATLRKNGAASGDFIAGDYARTTSSITKKFNGCANTKLLAGEYIDLRGYNDTGQTHAAQTTAGMNYIEIRRVGNY